MYELSQNIVSHTRDLRCLDTYQGFIATGGADKVFKLYNIGDQTNNGKVTQIFTYDLFDKNILSIKINRRVGNIFVLVGSADGKIHAFDKNGSPIALFQHDSQISSIDFINEDHFVTGSWDGKAIVWQISTQKKIAENNNHKHAVCVMYNPLSDQVISGSQDKALNCWNWKNGQNVKRKENAHIQIIRQISIVDEVGFITCSNDETLKLWSSDLQQIHRFTGHSAFVFTVKSKSIGQYFSGGDDKCLKIWDSEKTTQTIQFPASIWSIAIGGNGDIYAGCSDGYLRVFTSDQARQASQAEIETFKKQTLQSASKKSGMSAEDIKKLPNIELMTGLKGKKQGEIRVFKNGSIPQAFMWQAGKWQKIGEVITQSNSGDAGMSESRYYPGDKYFEAGEYDHIFEVDDQSGQRKTIPFNDGGNALLAAEKYCMRQGLTKGYIEQIRQFLMTNASKIPRSAIKKTQDKVVDMSNLRCTPQCTIIEYADIKNPSALFNKLSQFNSKIEGPSKLGQKQLAYCQKIAIALENSKTYHSWKLDFRELDTLKKMLAWPKQYRLPVWDIFRAFLCHYQSETFFSGLDAGRDLLSQLSAGLQLQYSEAVYAVIFKTLANTMIQNTNKEGIIKHGFIVFSSVEKFISQHKVTNKNLLSSITGFLFNYSVTINEKKLVNEQSIGSLVKMLKIRLEDDESEDNRGLLLQAAANVLFKHQNLKEQFQFLTKYLQHDDVSKDIEMLIA